jgi:hypothetical protein
MLSPKKPLIFANLFVSYAFLDCVTSREGSELNLLTHQLLITKWSVLLAAMFGHRLLVVLE